MGWWLALVAAYIGLAPVSYTEHPKSGSRAIAAPQVPSKDAEPTAPSKDLIHASFLAGLTDVKGPGIFLTLNDSSIHIPYAPTSVEDAGVIHDSDINGVINDLKAAGAEALSINDQRVVAMTAARGTGHTIFVNNVPQAPPYVIRAIGDVNILTAAMKQPNAVFESLSNLDSAMISIRSSDNLLIPSYTGPTQPRFAKPVLTPVNGGGGQ